MDSEFKDLLYADETLEALIYGYKIIQKKEGFRFGIDAVLLSDFAAAKKTDLMVDLGCGCAVIPILSAANTACCSIVGVELLPHYAEMAARSVAANGLAARVRILAGDYRSAELLPQNSFTLVTANPPYFKVGAGAASKVDDCAAARCEIFATIEEVAQSAARLLRPMGRFCLVHRPSRLVDVICALRAAGLEPKKLRLVQNTPEKAPSLFLCEAVKGGGAELRILPPLIVKNNGEYTEELLKIYRK